MTQTVARFGLQGAHQDFWNCKDPEVLHVGMAGTGKTLAASAKLHYTAVKYPGLRGLMLRATQVSLTATTLQTFQREVAHDAIATGHVKWFGGSAKEPPGFKYWNGSTITVASGERPERLLSLNLDRVMIDEAIEVTVDLYEVLISRLRGVAGAGHQIVSCTNPGHPKHWLKQRADRGDITLFTSTHRDNPAYVRPDGTYTEAGAAYLEKLERLTGVRRARLLEGRWVAAEGVVYDGWNEAYHVIKRGQLPHFDARQHPLYLSVDFGHTNPMVAQWWRRDDDGRLYLVRELYRTKMLVEDLAKLIKEVAAANPDEPVPTHIICDHDAGDRATLEKHLGRPTRPAVKAVSRGIEAVQSRLRTAGDGLPRLFVVRDALIDRDDEWSKLGKPCGLLEEMPSYVWAKSLTGVKEAPVKENDHSADAARYVVATLDLQGEVVASSPARASGEPTPYAGKLGQRVGR